MSGPVTLEIAIGAVGHVLELRAAGVPLAASTSMEELGLDSLDLAELMLTLERRAGCELDPASAADVQTVGDLVRLRALPAG